MKPGPEDNLVHLVQIVFPLPAQATEPMRRAAIAEAQNAKSTAKNCEDLLKIGKVVPTPAGTARVRRSHSARDRGPGISVTSLRCCSMIPTPMWLRRSRRRRAARPAN